MEVIKKTGVREPFDGQKIINAVRKSADRADIALAKKDEYRIVQLVAERIKSHGISEVPVAQIHSFVELALDEVNENVARSYRDYHNYRMEYANIMQDCIDYSLNLMTSRERENANADSDLVAVKQTLRRAYLDKKIYMSKFLSPAEKKAIHDGYIYGHDMSARMDTINCCLFDLRSVLDGGFTMGNMIYNEPSDLPAFFRVTGDVIFSVASQQYGGFTIPQIDEIAEKYCELSYKKYIAEMLEYEGVQTLEELSVKKQEKILQMAYTKIEYMLRKGFKSLEYKLNTVVGARGDYPFTTFTFGLSKSVWGQLFCRIMLETRKNGQGPNHIPVLFPKLVFLYDENLHGYGNPLEEVFEEAVSCSMKTMYPDYLSLSGQGYIADMYKKYGVVISPMGCRAFLSPWYERGGMDPADENDKPVYTGRFNIGVFSLNLPMIYMKAQKEHRDFYEILDYFLEMIRSLHLRTYAYLSNLRASCNPVAYCEGGFYGGHLSPTDRIEPVLKSATASFGITALRELQMLYNKKELSEDSEFSYGVLEYINKKVKDFSRKDGRLFAVYGTPAENLCGLQVKQFRAKYGIIEGVSDREYVSNSFHCHVTEDITPIQKQDIEYRAWENCNGGKIQYVRYPIDYNRNAIKSLVKRAMDMGFYEGVNLQLSFCNDCGFNALSIGSRCPKCGSENITEIDRMNGYLAYARLAVKNSDGSYVHYSRLNDAKDAEILDRKSM